MRRLQLLPCISFLCLAFISCKKENELGPQSSRLTMIRITEKDSIFYRRFEYNNQGRLSAITDSNNNGNKRRLDITYNSQGEILKVIEGRSICSFELDYEGRIIKKSVIRPGQLVGSIENTYSYDNSGRIVADSIYSYWTQAVYRTVTYTYDLQNNIRESKFIE